MRSIIKTNTSNGFTLVEMSVVMIIFGLIIASSATAYVQWQTWLRHETTKTNVEDVTIAIENFLLQNGRYPCPASLDASRTDGNAYGIEPAAGIDCETVVAGNIDTAGTPAGNDIFVVAGARAGNFLTPGTGVANAGNSQVRIGTIPYRNLGLAEEQAVDGYRNRLFYAVTEHLASSASYEQNTGRINVQNIAGTSYTQAPGETHYIVFSAGENGAGAFTQEGVQLPCPVAPAVENQNCDLANAVFVVDDFSTSNNANNLDDITSFGVAEVPKWERPQGAGANQNHAIASGNFVGFAPAASANPLEEVDVSGTIRAQDDPSTPEIEGQVKARELCVNNDPADPNCFDVSVITGLLTDGEGMQCPNPDEYIVGIQNNAPVCQVVNVGCTGNQMIIGIDANGVVDCGDPPPPGCPTQDRTFCGDTETLLPAASGAASQTLTFSTNGFNFTRTYQCNAGAWNQTGANPANVNCGCDPAPFNVQLNESCSHNPASTCGIRFTGTRDRQQERQCPSGNVINVTTRNGCVCTNSSSPDRVRNCATHWFRGLVPTQPPSGFRYNDGEVTAGRNHVCTSTTSGYCTGWQYRSDTCGCVDGPVRNGTPRPCSNGAPFEEIPQVQFTCSGKWGQDVEVGANTSACNCPTTPIAGTRGCTAPKTPIAPHTGVPTTTTYTLSGGVCSSATTDDGPEDNYCQAPLPPTYVWKQITGSQPIAGLAALIHGVTQCDPATDSGLQPLCRRGGQSFQCSCQIK